MDMDALQQELTTDEGKRYRPYRDSMGKLTVGIGRDLDAVPFSDDEITLMFTNDIQKSTDALDQNIPWWTSLTDARQRVLTNMCFNMGIGGLLQFKNMLSDIQSGDYESAAQEMLNSQWYKQVPNRVLRLSKMMEVG